MSMLHIDPGLEASLKLLLREQKMVDKIYSLIIDTSVNIATFAEVTEHIQWTQLLNSMIDQSRTAECCAWITYLGL